MQISWYNYEWAKQTKFLFAVIIGNLDKLCSSLSSTGPVHVITYIVYFHMSMVGLENFRYVMPDNVNCIFIQNKYLLSE